MKKALFASLFTLVLGFYSTAHAQIVLTIDDTNPADTIITASGSFTGTSITNAGQLQNGIDLLGLFTTPQGFNQFFAPNSAPAWTLTVASDSGTAFDSAYADTYSFHQGGTVDGSDLNLFASGSTATMSFTNGQAAFSGVLTLNLKGVSLVGLGSTGTIISGYYGGGDVSGGPGGVPNDVIGSYEIVPEPSSWALMLVGLAGLASLRRLRSRSN